MRDSLPQLLGIMSELTRIDAPSVTVDVMADPWSPDLTQCVATAPPHFSVCVKVTGPIQDGHLEALVQMGAHVRKVTATGLELQSDKHANADWLWGELSIGDAELSSLLRLPRPPPDTVIECSRISSRAMTQVSKTTHSHACAIL